MLEGKIDKKSVIEEVKELKKKLFSLNIRKSTGELENMSEIG